MTIARTLMPEDHEKDEVAHTALTRAGTGHALPSTMITGYRYAEMGYTACFEPAMLPANARQAHMELADTPLLDKGAFVMLGSDDFLLRAIAEKRDFEFIKDYMAWTMHAAQAIAMKVVNPGGISAFKFNQRKLDLDEKHVYYGITPRDIILTLARGLLELGVTHPLHVHGCNLGIPGNVETTLATIRRDGRPAAAPDAHPVPQLRHRGRPALLIGRGADRRPARTKYPNISIDVGQVMFGQTCTASGDSMRQYNGSKNADPKRWVVMDIECDAGCGVVPFRYRDKSYVHALQWAIGLETFLLVRGSLAHLPDHRPSQRRAVLHLPASDPPAHGPRLPPRDDAARQPGRAEVLDAADARARILALRDRHPHPRRPGAQPRPQGSSATSAPAPRPTSPSTRTMPTARRCSRRPCSCSRTAS